MDGFEPGSNDLNDPESLGMRVRVMSYVGSGYERVSKERGLLLVQSLRGLTK
jgi:hypothetical protein